MARVFYNEGISGNLTGVVQLEKDIGDIASKKMATRLQLPDTAFIWKENSMKHRTYSPYEELEFCTQTLLATGAVQKIQSKNLERFEFEGATGLISVFTQGDDIWWIEQTPGEISPYYNYDVLNELSISKNILGGMLGVGGNGRKRLYIPINSEENLYIVHLKPSLVMNICQRMGINGIVLFVKKDQSNVLLRVFTTSLAGNEDAATGGAALGLLGYNQLFSFGLSNNIRVDQGHIDSSSRGCIYLKNDVENNQNLIGSKVDVLIEGLIL
ncbi:PhzF family phenazine biosynthesis protein [Lysinibacillus mangiferihumi]|nr:PhzF family phenazine biosynthesis protein [Lysinibacillus mangiferihumi]